MTPDYKAKELVDEYQKQINLFTGNEEMYSRSFAKTCATIAVDEIMQEYRFFKKDITRFGNKMNFWQQVKEAITKL